MSGIERFDAYVDRCLYDPDHGFYRADRGRAGGRRGDFITSPEVGPLFATVLARAVDGWWAEAGEPEILPVFDAGSGPGSLARVLDAAPGPSQSARQVQGFDRPVGGPGVPADVLGRLPGAIVIANELLDNLAPRIIEKTEDGWAEVYVMRSAVPGTAGTAGADGAPGVDGLDGIDAVVGERLVPLELADEPDLQPWLDEILGPWASEIAVGARVPVQAHARQWVRDVVESEARLVVFDYGCASTAELVERGGWLRTYRRHERGHDPYREPGEWDITVDVAFDQLPPPERLSTQAEFLLRHGIDDLVEQGREHWRRHAARPDLEAMKMRSRVSEAEALLEPAGLGSWLVAEWEPGKAGARGR